MAQTEGGLNVKDGSRTRSKGGVFFHLARQTLDPAGRRYVWPIRRPSNATKAEAKGWSGPSGWRPSANSAARRARPAPPN
jgi:hypothetical protein